MKYFFVYLLLCVGLISCYNNNPNYPVEPIIEFVSASKTEVSPQEAITFTIKFTDGDGNLGSWKNSNSKLSCSGATLCDTINRTDSSCYFDFNADAIIFDSRDGCMPNFPILIADLSDGGKNAYAEGEIDLVFSTITNCACVGCENDTVVYSLQLKDRAQNYSNIVQTTPIIIKGCN